MRRKFFGVRPTNKLDVYLAAGAAVMAVLGFFGTLNEYKTDQNKEEENDA